MMVTPNTSDERASGRSTLKMICRVVAPIASAASITPLSTSLKDCSVTLAKNGVAEMLSGTMAAVVPMEVPTSHLVKLMIATIRMMKGIDRPRLTTAPKTVLINLFGLMWPGT